MQQRTLGKTSFHVFALTLGGGGTGMVGVLPRMRSVWRR